MNEKKDKDNNGRWKCPVCQVEADVDGRGIHVYAPAHIWPLHSDCEFANDLDHIDFSKLERIA